MVTRGEGVLSSPLDIAADSARAGLTKGGFLGQPRIAVAVVAPGKCKKCQVVTRGPPPLDIAADSARAGLTKGGFLGQPRIAVAVVAAGLAYSGCGGCGGTVV